MKTTWRRLISFAIFGFLALTPVLSAKDKKPKASNTPKDEIQVIGHVDLTAGSVTNIFITQHYSSSYLYAEHGAGKAVTLVDVTKADKPAVLGNMAYSSNGGENLTLVAGTAALVSTAPQAGPPSSAASETIRVMDFSDPQHPKVAREFTGVTAVTRDDRRGLVFVADGSGIWILQQKLATDPAVEKAYADYVLYSH